MSLSFSEAVWDMIVANARKALSLQTQWQSLRDKRPYRIINVTDKTITIKRLRGGDNSEFGKELLRNRLEKINEYGGRLSRREFGAGVANMSTIVFLHPLLSWSADFSTVIAIEDSQPLNTASHETYPTIPNDEEEKQKVARRIRRGQRKFRDR